MNTYRGVEVQLYTFLTAALDCGVWSRPTRITPGKESSASLDRLCEPHSRSGRCKKERDFFYMPGIETQLLGRPPRSLVTKQSCTG
jgi:hypothetical protein